MADGASWSCPHELEGLCTKVKGLTCDPGMKGCTLYGRYVFFNDDKNERIKTTTTRRKKEEAS